MDSCFVALSIVALSIQDAERTLREKNMHPTDIMQKYQQAATSMKECGDGKDKKIVCSNVVTAS